MILKRKKVSFIFLFILLFPFLSYSQSSSSNKYIGIIDVKNIGIFPYQLDFNISENKITGTNVGNKYETSTAIRGTINSKGAIEFSETNVLKTNIKDKNISLCLVSAKLTPKTVLEVEVLEGKFTGSDNNKKFCGSGTIRLIKEVEEITNALKTLSQENEIKKLSNIDVNQITATSRDVKIRVYDNGVIDEDEIKITYNNIVLSNKKTLDKEGKIIHIKIEETKDNLLEIKTLNEGRYPPNTANVEITVNGQIRTYTFNAPVNTNIKLKFVYGE